MTTEELITHPEQVVSGQDVEKTMPWYDWKLEVAEPDEAWPAAVLDDPATEVIPAVPAWPAEDVDRPAVTDLLPMVGSVQRPIVLPSTPTRHRRARTPLAERITPRMQRIAAVLTLVVISNLCTGVLAAVAAHEHWRWVFVVPACLVFPAALFLAWVLDLPHRETRDADDAMARVERMVDDDDPPPSLAARTKRLLEQAVYDDTGRFDGDWDRLASDIRALRGGAL